VGGIDLHAHLAPRIDPSSHGLGGIGTAEDGRLTEDGTPLGPVPLYRPELLTAYLDRADLDQAVVSIPPPFFRQDQPSDDAARWARAVNDGILAAVAAHPRLLPLAYLPLEHPEVAVAEDRSRREDARFVGVVGAAGGRSVSLADDRFGELWKLMHDDRKLLLLHPGVSPDDRLTPFYLQNLLGNPVETAVATAELVFGDVLARHPGLRVLLVHCGGCVPAVAGSTVWPPAGPVCAPCPSHRNRRCAGSTSTASPTTRPWSITPFPSSARTSSCSAATGPSPWARTTRAPWCPTAATSSPSGSPSTMRGTCSAEPTATALGS